MASPDKLFLFYYLYCFEYFRRVGLQQCWLSSDRKAYNGRAGPRDQGDMEGHGELWPHNLSEFVGFVEKRSSKDDKASIPLQCRKTVATRSSALPLNIASSDLLSRKGGGRSYTYFRQMRFDEGASIVPGP